MSPPAGPQVWCSWPEVETWAQQLGLHTVPVLRRGEWNIRATHQRPCLPDLSLPRCLTGLLPARNTGLPNAARWHATSRTFSAHHTSTAYVLGPALHVLNI